MTEALVIGYGNTLRGDDGVGRVLAEEIATDARARGIRVISCVQLTPELAFDLASARRVVFVDASADEAPGSVRVRSLRRGDGQTMTHHMTPEALLGLAAALYGATPEAALLSIGVESTEIGTDIASESVRAAMPGALERVLEHLDKPA